MNNEIRTLQVYKGVHSEIAKLAAWNDVKMRDLASAMLTSMLEKHKDEIDQIIKQLKQR